jgi:phenylacetate-CoA ligase
MWLQEIVVDVASRWPATHRFLLAPGGEELRWKLGRWRAYQTFERTARLVPAYRSFLGEHGCPATLPTAGDRWAAFTAIPIMDKGSYISRYSIADRCLYGRIPRRGVVVDESSGSSGRPTSWVRGPVERRASRQLLQLGFAQSAAGIERPPFVINAFSLGAWATGMNVSASLTGLTVIKSCGPDRDKIINTMLEFGPGFTYVITSYPPFLKGLLEDERLDWSQYDVICAFGGEGISEGTRDHILKRARSVIGAYGASDLEINIAIETEFTIALRRAIAANPELSSALTRQAEFGVLPSVFQFNPYNYLIETNEVGELIITITRPQNINPRIRYNIHDRGHVLRMPELLPVLRRFGLRDVLDAKLLDLPVLLHYGRSDLSVDYNGAVVPPDGLRDVINSDPELMDLVENHRLISYEDAAGDRRLHLALQLCSGRRVADPAAAARRVFAAMRRANGDFHNAIKTSAAGTEPTLGFYPFRGGVFAGDGAKLKNEYVWTLDAPAAAAAGIEPQFTAER